ncbi:hypothetical protein SAMN03159496_06137 [Rhizobium sp. NFR07]|uniref:hypothetical protein n=1 Tax=Rhizobium sp. NFR07 TaxID=1566262 RepID=UPI0008E2557F|nr:hypothetical protein [Rhizobium sp. NFR07]SFB63003.1 hypothetical protein SAMN03159496_06137 [Rhizobium sp. NFR07]
MSFSTQYIVRDPYQSASSDRMELERRLGDLGLLREAFTISDEIDGRSVLTFWEPDRSEALRILSIFEPTACHVR